ncbi:hypothetical protein C0J52_06321 [Blattella germanica]|nr:hypothetical protein C0J52_06321 [Blattella germanica]
MLMYLHSLLTFRNFATRLELLWLWSAVACWSLYGESWITALISAISPRVDTLNTFKVCNLESSSSFSCKYFHYPLGSLVVMYF